MINLINLKNYIKMFYNIDVLNIEKSDESTVGNVYFIYSNNKKYVLKIYDNLNHTKSITELHILLKNLNINVPEIIFTIENKKYAVINNNFLVIYSFINGKQLEINKKTNRLDTDLISLIAKNIRKMHNLTENIIITNLEKCPIKINKNIKRNSVLHFDLTKNNIFIDNKKVYLIDLDDAKYGPAIFDVSILIANLFFSKTRGIDNIGITKFIDEYYGNDITLKNKEIKYIKECALNWIDYTLNNNDFESSLTESFTFKRKLIENFNF